MNDIKPIIQKYIGSLPPQPKITFKYKTMPGWNNSGPHLKINIDHFGIIKYYYFGLPGSTNGHCRYNNSNGHDVTYPTLINNIQNNINFKAICIANHFMYHRYYGLKNNYLVIYNLIKCAEKQTNACKKIKILLNNDLKQQLIDALTEAKKYNPNC